MRTEPGSYPMISVISPVYKSENTLEELVKRVIAVLSELTDRFEIILVDDRSPDNCWKVIEQLCQSNPGVKGVRLSRNSGQQKAILAGMEAASGDYLVVMDCDLQEDVQYISDLYNEIQKGNDIVVTTRKSRKFSWFRNVLTRLFYSILSFLANSSFALYNTGILSMINRKAANAMLSINKKNWFYLPVLFQVGFQRSGIEIEHQERHSGSSSYSFRKLYLHGINLILGYSLRLLHISIGMGILFVILAFIWAAYLIIIYFNGTPPSGYTSTMLALLLFTGFILSSIGVLGLYIGKIFDQAKNDPDYFIDETLNF